MLIFDPNNLRNALVGYLDGVGVERGHLVLQSAWQRQLTQRFLFGDSVFDR